MALSPFVLFALGVLSSSISSSHGFSASRLLSSNTLKKSFFRQIDQQKSHRQSQRRFCDRGNVLLHVATDPTTIASNTDEDGGSSYDFISVEEAEEALQRERARYEGERSDLQWLLEVQRQQLQDLAEGRGGKMNTGDGNRSGHGRSVDAANSPSRIVILGSVNANVKSNTKRNRKRGSSRNSINGNDRGNTNSNDDNYIRMQQLENLLQDAIVENKKLTRRLREQHHQYNVERSVYEDELQEERGRLNYIRDELHMERAYFETSQRMLENVLVEEQQNVQELEKELLMMMNRDQVFSQDNRSQDEYQELEHEQQSQTQYVQEEHRQSPMNNENRYQQEKTGRGRTKAGFTMNINDVQCPLYP